MTDTPDPEPTTNTPITADTAPLATDTTNNAESNGANANRKRSKKRRRKHGPKVVIRPIAVEAAPKKRHWGLALAFLIIVLVPIATSAWYLYTRAADQYATTLGFTVRSEDVSSSADLLSGLGSSIGGSASRDTDILYEFILSRGIVSRITAQLDLPKIYSKYADIDPLMSYDSDGTIEDLTRYWQRMVRVSYDAGSGLMELRVLAFDPQDAMNIATAIYDESTATINELSAIARNDATRYAQEDLDLALERLKVSREQLTSFRLANQIVDPNADIQVQMGLLTTLQEQQANALIEFDLLSDSAIENDPRLDSARRRLEVIEARIAQERQKFGAGGAGPGGVEYATTISDFERLSVDREFAETAYAATLSAYDGARAEANRQSRYLATYIAPMPAERPEFPQRELFIAIIAAFSFLTWAIASLVYYSLRDRG